MEASSNTFLSRKHALVKWVIEAKATLSADPEDQANQVPDAANGNDHSHFDVVATDSVQSIPDSHDFS